MNDWLARTVDRLYGYRLAILVPIHSALIVAANQAAFWLRFDGVIPAAQQPHVTSLIPLLVVVRLAVFLPLRLHQGVWRYASIWDLRNIVAGVAFSSLLFWTIVHGVIGATAYPRSVFIVDALLLICLMGGLRLGRRLWGFSGRRDNARRVLIYGAGDAGEMIARDMLVRRESDRQPVGFLDDSPTKRGQKIHGVPVVGGSDAVVDAIRRLRPDEILIAMPGADPAELRGVMRALASTRLPITTLPNLRDILDGKIEVGQIRRLAVEDLLPRAPIGFDPKPVRALLRGRHVLVTGAGGSIGSELCRQIATFHPASLILYERYENNLHAIAMDLADRGFSSAVHPVVGDVTDLGRLQGVFAEHLPEIVFHAAAHKHVPLMEWNPCEAVKNNVMGTRLLSKTSEQFGVERFILISTDKAVNPTSVMGATKRVAELLVQSVAAGSRTLFCTVRFGNVLASNGSVVSRFTEQIAKGGPVTVTHPEMRRFFMLIPEAVQLVLHVAAKADAGEAYILEMGEQIRVVDLARDLIRLLGHVPDEEVPIVFTGMRPGEKLFEELAGDDEVAGASDVKEIRRVWPRHRPERAWLDVQVGRLEELALGGDRDGVFKQLAAIVPAYRPDSTSLKPEDVSQQARPDAVIVRGQSQGETPEAVRTDLCPCCGSANFRRSRTRTLRERLHKALAGHEQLSRCRDCGWRGWHKASLAGDDAVPSDRRAAGPDDAGVLPPAEDRPLPNLAALDATVLATRLQAGTDSHYASSSSR